MYPHLNLQSLTALKEKHLVSVYPESETKLNLITYQSKINCFTNDHNDLLHVYFDNNVSGRKLVLETAFCLLWITTHPILVKNLIFSFTLALESFVTWLFQRNALVIKKKEMQLKKKNISKGLCRKTPSLPSTRSLILLLLFTVRKFQTPRMLQGKVRKVFWLVKEL